MAYRGDYGGCGGGGYPGEYGEYGGGCDWGKGGGDILPGKGMMRAGDWDKGYGKGGHDPRDGYFPAKGYGGPGWGDPYGGDPYGGDPYGKSCGKKGGDPYGADPYGTWVMKGGDFGRGDKGGGKKGTKEGDWDCLACGDLQFARNDACRKCGADRDGRGGKDIGHKGGGKKGTKEGDWDCLACGDLQFARNDACRKCGADRDGRGGKDTGHKGGGKKGTKEGDWDCLACGDLQFARNDACRKCGADRDGGGGKDIGHKGGGKKGTKEGDWDCLVCGDLQFGRNDVCRKCGADKEGVGGSDRGGGMTMASGGGGDWLCPACGDLQFARNNECRKCGAEKGDNPEYVGKDGGGKGKGKGKDGGGDWLCSACGDLQFARNTACRKCGADKGNNPTFAGPDAGKGGFGMKGGKKGSGKVAQQDAMDAPITDKIWVGGLPSDVTANALGEYFSSNFGPVKSVDMKQDKGGMPRGFAFVFFESADTAKEVIRNHKDNMYNGQWIDCKPAVAEDKGKGKGGKDYNDAPVTEKLFVNSLPLEATEDAVVFHFCQFGNVKEASLKKDANGVFRGFAFLTFESAEEAQLVLDSPDAQVFEGKTLDIKPAVAKEGGKDFGGKGKGKGAGKGISVGCIPLHATEAHVRQYFEYFGTVADVVMESDEMGMSRGAAHVIFENPDSSRQVLSHYGENGGQFNPLEWEAGILLDIKAGEAPKRGSDCAISEKMFVGSLPRHLKQNDIEKAYSEFGPLKEVFMKCENDGSFRGHCFVTYRDVESARKALDASASGNTLGTCRPFAASPAAAARDSAQAPPDSNVLKITGLPADPKSRDVFRYFYSFSVTRIRDTGDAILVEFSSDAECLKAFKDKSGAKLGSHYCTLSGGTKQELADAAEAMKAMKENKGGGKGGRDSGGDSHGGGYSPY